MADIRQASCNRGPWKKLNDDGLIFSCQSIDYGWFVKNNKLVRYQGIYDPDHNKWGNHTVSLVAERIQKLLGTPLTQTKCIQVVIQGQEYTIKGLVAMRVGVRL
jgi:hypothetical protein